MGLRLVRTAPGGRIVLAHAARVIDPEWILRPWGDEIAAELEAAGSQVADPLSARAVERALRDAWGAKPTDELDELDLEPVAVTPTSQVHRGVLEGAPVAVKLRRPGLAASVRQDLVLLDGLLIPLGAAFPALDAAALIREVRELVQDELDLEHEAHNQRRFHRALRGHPFLTVPAPVTRLAHEGVLVSEWIDGVPLAALANPGAAPAAPALAPAAPAPAATVLAPAAPDLDTVAARLLAFVIGAARFGVMHADPDPDDVLVLADGRLAILDFGAARDVIPERVDGVATALDAFADGDGAAIGSALAELGALPAEEGALLLDFARHVLGELAGSGRARLDTPAVLAARERLRARPDQVVRLLLAASIAPEDLWPMRGIGQLFAVIARLGASGDWLELARAALRDGWDAAE